MAAVKLADAMSLQYAREANRAGFQITIGTGAMEKAAAATFPVVADATATALRAPIAEQAIDGSVAGFVFHGTGFSVLDLVPVVGTLRAGQAAKTTCSRFE
jgi:hypothetical protein